MTDPHELFRPTGSDAPPAEQFPAAGATPLPAAPMPWAQSQYGQPQYGQPQYGQPQYGQTPLAAEEPFSQHEWAGLPAAPPTGGARRRSAVVAGAAVAVLVAGGVAYTAVREKNHGSGAASAQGAVKSIVSDLGKSDILGVLDDLPPAERAAVQGSFLAQVKQLKRLQVLEPSANPGKVAGVQFAAKALTYDKSDEVVNDHVRIVKLTGGTVTINSDATRVPFTKQFLAAAFGGHPPTDKSSDTYDLALNAKPVRIAVQRVGGKWYPSVLYTAMDASIQDAGLPNPTSRDAVPAIGASSADDSVRRTVAALLNNDYNAAVALLNPTEDAAFHDYAKLLTRSVGAHTGDAQLNGITFRDTKVDGGVRVSVTSATFTVAGQKTTVSFDEPGCVTMTSSGKTERECALDALQAQRALHLTARERAAVTDLLDALPKIGVVATNVGTKWFVSPVRSYADIDLTVLSNLKDDDLLVLVKLARSQ